ncbi:MAG: hypothetical protein HZB40_16735 [Rhodocyclales bacterium]|nr:hypothetical protein [Rhodocyclales bacterium]
MAATVNLTPGAWRVTIIETREVSMLALGESPAEAAANALLRIEGRGEVVDCRPLTVAESANLLAIAGRS